MNLKLLAAVCVLAGGVGAQTIDAVRQIRNAPYLDSRTFDWSYMSGLMVSGNLTASGSGKVLAFTSSPSGINASSPSKHYVYISGGVGTAEAALITATTCTAGGSSCTATITTANTHSGSWSASSASGGIQEAVCALPSIGGEVTVANDVMLRANVSSCNKANVEITKRSGVLLTNAQTYTILSQRAILEGNSVPVELNSPTRDREVFSTKSVPQTNWYAGPFDGTKYRSYYFKQGDTIADGYMGPGTQETMTVTIDVPAGAGAATGTRPTPSNHGAAIAGHGMTHDDRVNAIGVFGNGLCDSDTGAAGHTSCFGVNGMGGTTTESPGNESVFGSEFDVNLISPNAYNAAAHFASGASRYQASNISAAFWNHQLGPVSLGTCNRSGANVTLVSGFPFDPYWNTSHPAIRINGANYVVSTVSGTSSLVLQGSPTGTENGVSWSLDTIMPFKYGFLSGDGAATSGLHLGTLFSTSTLYPGSQSQYLNLQARANDSSLKTVQLFTGINGFLNVVAPAGGGMVVSGGDFQVANGVVKYPTYTFATKPNPVSPAGSVIFCSDCLPTSTCSGGGSGHLAVSNGSSWTCQ